MVFPLSAAATPNPAGFDILGMKLGMSVAQIEAAIKAYNPSLTIGIARIAIANPKLGVGKFVQFVHAGHPGALADTVAVGFTVTQPSRAFYIGRLTQFPPEQRPLTDKTLQQLREKYGPESRSLNGAGLSAQVGGQLVGRTDFEWGVVKAGKPLIRSCAPVGPAAFWYTDQFRFGSLSTQDSYWPECGADLVIELQPSPDPHLLASLFEQLIGDSIAVDDIQKLTAEATAAQQRQRQQQEQRAAGVKPSL
jgi:hypothetical protein